MQYTPYIFWIMLAFWVIFLTVSFNWAKVKQAFNLVDKRSLFTTEQTYQKFNALLVDGDVSVDNRRWSGEPEIHLTVKYKNGQTSETSTFDRSTMESAVNDAYTWASSRGYIKE